MKKNLLVTAILLFTLLGSMMAQTRTITGKVTSSEDGQPLPGANVLVVDRGIGTITDAGGNYSLDVPTDAQSLEFRFVGMEDQIVAIGNQTVIDIALAVSAVALDEVVVTSLGYRKGKESPWICSPGT